MKILTNLKKDAKIIVLGISVFTMISGFSLFLMENSENNFELATCKILDFKTDGENAEISVSIKGDINDTDIQWFLTFDDESSVIHFSGGDLEPIANPNLIRFANSPDTKTEISDDIFEVRRSFTLPNSEILPSVCLAFR